MSSVYRKYRPLVSGEKLDIAFIFLAGTVWPSLETVYENCIENTSINAKIILVTETSVEKAHSKNAVQFLETKGYKYEKYTDIDFETYVPHVVVFQFPYDAAFNMPNFLSLNFVRRGTRVVYVPYGIEISDTRMARLDHFNSRVVENAWRVYISSEGIKQEYNKYCRNRNSIRVMGSPKFDSINRKDEILLTDDISRKVRGKRIIVWKIHFPKKNIINGVPSLITPELNEYIKFAKKLDKYSDFFFVILPHPKLMGKMVESDYQGDNSLVEFSNQFRRIIDLKDNVIIDMSDDYRNSLYNADAIIMDRSAVMVEAGMTGKPILLMRNRNFEEPMVQPVAELISTYQQGYTCADMEKFVEDFSQGKSFDNSERMRMLSKWFPFMDGNCGKRIAEDIYESIVNESKEVDKLKVVIYGTGEIASYYLREQNWLNNGTFDIVAITDSDERKWGEDYFEHKIISPEQLKKTKYDVIVIMTEAYYYEIKKKLVYDLYMDERIVYPLDEFVVQFGGGS